MANIVMKWNHRNLFVKEKIEQKIESRNGAFESREKERECTWRIRWGEENRHLALHRGSLRSSPWRSSSVARPPSMTAEPPVSRSKSVINDDIFTPERGTGIPAFLDLYLYLRIKAQPNLYMDTSWPNLAPIRLYITISDFLPAPATFLLHPACFFIISTLPLHIAYIDWQSVWVSNLWLSGY